MKLHANCKSGMRLFAVFICICAASCNVLKQQVRSENKNVPASYGAVSDTTSAASLSWREYFDDPDLAALIDTALLNNQDLNAITQEIEVSRNEIRTRKGDYLPFVGIGAGADVEKVGRYTRNGAVEEQLTIREGQPFPEPLTNYDIGFRASWEVDIWHKLRTAREASVARYLAGVEGRHFMVTQLIAEIAENYYELMALDNLLEIIGQNITIQSDALEVVKQQKDAARVTQLAVNRFEAQLLNTKNLQYEIRQRITEAENRINYLTGRFPKQVVRSSVGFIQIPVDTIMAGIPSQLLDNRPDIRQAELELTAAKLDVKVAKAEFYPSLDLRAGLGFEAFNPAYLIQPQSLLYNLAGDLVAPLVNRNAIKAAYLSSNAKQLQAVIDYEKTILEAYVDVVNQVAKVENYTASLETKTQEVQILNASVSISNNLFNSARADYAEVLLTQREALEGRIDLVEIKLQQMQGVIQVYRALGGGWR